MKYMIGKQYKHKNGNIYTVLFLTNTAHIDTENHPIDVVYMGQNGNIWSRKLSDWDRSFEAVGKTEVLGFWDFIMMKASVRLKNGIKSLELENVVSKHNLVHSSEQTLRSNRLIGKKSFFEFNKIRDEYIATIKKTTTLNTDL